MAKRFPWRRSAEQREGNLQAIQQRAKVQRDSINYFPTRASRPCAILFFPELGSRALPYDVVDISNDRACLGRLYFKIPGGITFGQHWLNVKFQNSLVRVPFRILTADEEKLLSKNYKSIEKQVKEAFKPNRRSKPIGFDYFALGNSGGAVYTRRARTLTPRPGTCTRI